MVHFKSIEKFEFSNSYALWTVGSVSNFWKKFGVEFGLTPKREFLPHNLCYKYANLQKLWISERICFKWPNRAIQSQLSRLFRFRLTLNTFRNSITSTIVRFSLCMPSTSKRRICKPSWGTPCPSLNISGFISVISIYLSEQFLWFF
jgi:hypothetical protein